MKSPEDGVYTRRICCREFGYLDIRDLNGVGTLVTDEIVFPHLAISLLNRPAGRGALVMASWDIIEHDVRTLSDITNFMNRGGSGEVRVTILKSIKDQVDCSPLIASQLFTQVRFSIKQVYQQIESSTPLYGVFSIARGLHAVTPNNFARERRNIQSCCNATAKPVNSSALLNPAYFPRLTQVDNLYAVLPAEDSHSVL